MGLVALILKYALLVGVLVYVIAVLRAMILTMPCADAGRPRRSSAPPARTPVRRPRPRQHPASRASRSVAPEPVPPEPSEPEPPPEPEVEVEPTQVFAAEPEPLPPAEKPTAAMFAARSDPEAESLPVPKPPPATTPITLPVEVRDSLRDGPVLSVDDPGESHLVAGALVYLGHGIHVGRAPENDLVIDSPAISRQHAYIGPRGEAWLLVDKGSANGTFVNGRRVTGPQELADGDILTLGNVSFVLDLRGGGPAG